MSGGFYSLMERLMGIRSSSAPASSEHRDTYAVHVEGMRIHKDERASHFFEAFLELLLSQ